MDKQNIGAAARASGVSPKMIRHYESVGLFPEALRSSAGYRLYGDNEIATLRFIRQARDLGFAIEQIRELLSLWQNRRRSSRQVRALAQAHLQALEAKRRDLEAMSATLAHLVDRCHGDERPDCPIIEALAGEGPVSRGAASPRAKAGARPRGRRDRGDAP